jgi:hypothetical protein
VKKALNYSILVGPNAVVERDSFTCGHCQRIVFVPPGRSATDIGGGCRICHHLICGRCVDLGICKPFEQQIAEIERNWERDRMLSRLIGR